VSRLVISERKVDLNPMLDVVFILLIFFIITSTFLQEQGLVAPESSPAAKPPPDAVRPVVLVIDSSNRYQIDGSWVDVRLLTAQLQRLHSQQPQAALVVRSSAQASTEAVVRVLDATGLAGIQKVSFDR